jgi:hypothetical protein
MLVINSFSILEGSNESGKTWKVVLEDKVEESFSSEAIAILFIKFLVEKLELRKETYIKYRTQFIAEFHQTLKTQTKY